MMFVFLLACVSEDPRSVLIQSWGEDIFLPSYSLFVDATQGLHHETLSFCDNPNPSSLTQVQGKWWEARTPWKKMEFLSFGPYKNLPERLGPQIDFWPVRTNTVDEILAGSQSLTAEDFLSFGASSKGFPVIEYLLYDYLPNHIDDERGCAYLMGSTADLAQKSNDMYTSWSPEGGNYLGQLVEPQLHSGDFENIEESLAEVVNRLGHTIENIRADKLQKGLGGDTGEIQPSFIESRFSHRSFQDIRDNLEGIHFVYFGSSQGQGIDDYLIKRGYNLDEDFLDRYQRSLDTIYALEQNGTLMDNMYVDPDGVRYLSEQLSGLQTIIQGDILGAMSLWLTFNDADGD